jgi:FkbM family methyltransferase
MTCQLIYDVGAHAGEDTDFYLKKGFKVVAIEANPDLAGRLRDKFPSNVSDGSLIVVDAAIAESDGEVDFYTNQTSVWGTIRPAMAERNAALGGQSKVIKVRTTSFRELLSRFGIPHYLKVDIEGADLLCLEGLLEQSERPRFVSIESEKRSWPELLHEFELLTKLGYSRFKIIDQERVGRQRPPRPATEGRYVDHAFQRGSSGLFGDELPGKWMTKRQAIRRYMLIFLTYRLFGDFGIVRRFFPVAAKNASGPRVLPAKAWPILRTLFRRTLKAHWYDTHAAL